MSSIHQACALLLCILSSGAFADVDWQPLACPSISFNRPCTQRGNPSQDTMVSLFYQFEGKQAGGFSCTSSTPADGAGPVLCGASWSLPQQGAAGTCVFLLAAGSNMKCQGTGGVTNLIGAHGLVLSAPVLSAPLAWATLSCPAKGKMSGSCTGKAADSDRWMNVAFSSTRPASLSCRLASTGTEVCSWSTVTRGATTADSCSFLVPATDSLDCTTTGGPTVTSSATVKLSRQISQQSSHLESEASCPVPTLPKGTLCNCNYKNVMPHDSIVTINAQNVDNAFNSFHCSVGDANTCGWGTANGQQGEAGSCSFILPAGEPYTCAMQWGATGFGNVSITPLAVSLFSKKTTSSHSTTTLLGAAFVSVGSESSRSEASLSAMYDEWRTAHSSGAGDSIEFENFKAHVALVDSQPGAVQQQYNSLAGLSRDQFEQSYRGCAHSGDSGKHMEELSGLSAQDVADAPESVDWRQQHVVRGTASTHAAAAAA